MTSSKMSATTFIEHLEAERATFDDDIHPLPKYQKDAFESCCQLLQEDGASLAQRSKQHRSSRLRARTLLIDVFDGFGAEVFLLCTLATIITRLSTITHKDLFPMLRTWWKTAEHPQGLRECANGLYDANSITTFIIPSREGLPSETTGLHTPSSFGSSALIYRKSRIFTKQAYSSIGEHPTGFC